MTLMTHRRIRDAAALGLFCMAVTACSTQPVQQDGPPQIQGDAWAAPEPEPATLPRSRYGNPEEYVVFGKRYRVMDSSRGFRQEGRASWYGQKFHGQRTSSGEPFDMFALTAAHRELPIPCIARVTNLDNGKTVRVRINDRGPFHSNRVLDLSWAAAVRLDLINGGTGRIRLEVLESESPASVATIPPATPPATIARETVPEPRSFNIDAEIQQAARPLKPELTAIAQPVAATSVASSPEPKAIAPENRTLYFLQVGAFRDVALAERTRQRFRSLGYPVPSESRYSGGWHRVWIGPWTRLDTAQGHSQQLQDEGYKNLLIADPPRP